MKTIKQMPKNSRPRERLIKLGSEVLSDEELLAIILKTGTKGITSRDLALNILSIVKSVVNLKKLNYQQLLKINGIGPAKACEITSLIELSKRMNKQVIIDDTTIFNNSQLVYYYYKDKLEDKMQEYFYCLYLDNKKKLIEDKQLFLGTINQSIVHPREVFKHAFTLSASSIICVHNHPSGDVTPSLEDMNLTNRLKSIGKLVGIPINDHIIIGKDKYYSFFENNKI